MMHIPTQLKHLFLLPIIALIVGLFLALGGAIFLMAPPAWELLYLFGLLLFSSIPSLMVSAVLFWLTKRWLRLRGQIMLAYILGLGVALANVFVTSQMMFLSGHDLTLLMLLLGFAATLSLSVGITLAGVLARGMEELSSAATKVADGQYKTRVALTGADELGTLGQAFNTMAARVEESIERVQAADESRRNMIAAISHDLRTPVASTRVMIEALTDGVVTDRATQERYLTTVRTQLEQLGFLIDDLFDLARLEAGNLNLEIERSAIEDLISDTLQSMRPQAQTRGLSLEGYVNQSLPPVMMDARQIQRVLNNLVQNAIRHTVRGKVTISAHPIDTMVEVVVQDTGEGIDPKDLLRLFERFYRGDKSRSRETGGAGLGLAIARGIIEAHGGTISAENASPRGAIFRFRLPADRTPASVKTPPHSRWQEEPHWSKGAEAAAHDDQEARQIPKTVRLPRGVGRNAN